MRCNIAIAGSRHDVPLAFDHHERWTVDISESNRSMVRGHEPDRQQMSHEDSVAGLEIELSSETSWPDTQ